MASEIRVNQIQNRSGLTTTTLTDTGVTIAGILTVSENLNVGGVLTYEDVTNIDSVGVVTARSGINLVGNDLNVGSNIKIGNASGIVTATTFVGNLTGNVTGTASANAVLTGSTNNQLVTVTGANAITGEANLTFDGNDLTVTGTAPAINFIDTDADDYKIHNVQGLLKVTDTTASADRLVINDNGTGYFLSNFQIGSTTSSPGATLHIKTSYPSLKVDSGGHASDAYVRIIAGNAQNSRVDFGDTDDDNIGIIDYDHNGNYMSFTTNASERLRIDSSGRLILGHTTAPHSDNDKLQVVTTGGGTGVIVDEYSADVWGPSISMLKSRNASIGGNTVVQSGDRLADFNFYGNDGAGRALGAQIGVRVDGTPGSDDMPSRIIFKTSADGSQSPTERLSIKSDGKILIPDSGKVSVGPTSPAARFTVGPANGSRCVEIEEYGVIRGYDRNSSAWAEIAFEAATYSFDCAGTERVRIENLGDSEYGLKFKNSKAIEFKDQGMGIFTLTWSINANTWTNFFSHQSYFQGWLFLNGTHNAGNSSALWSISKSPSGGSACNRFAHDNLYGPATIDMRMNGLWTQIKSSYATYGYATLIALAGGNDVANLSG